MNDNSKNLDRLLCRISAMEKEHNLLGVRFGTKDDNSKLVVTEDVVDYVSQVLDATLQLLPSDIPDFQVAIIVSGGDSIAFGTPIERPNRPSVMRKHTDQITFLIPKADGFASCRQILSLWLPGERTDLLLVST